MKLKLASVIVALLIGGLATWMISGPSTAMAFPEPSIAAQALEWRYDFEDEHIKCIAVPRLDGEMEYYWYRFTDEEQALINTEGFTPVYHDGSPVGGVNDPNTYLDRLNNHLRSPLPAGNRPSLPWPV